MILIYKRLDIDTMSKVCFCLPSFIEYLIKIKNKFYFDRKFSTL